MFGLKKSSSTAPSGPRCRRAYAIGDVHGRLDLLDQLLAAIHEEIGQDPPGETLLILLGDLIDRGPSSAQVIERLRTYRHSTVQPVFLLGNHEEVLLRILGGETGLIPGWLRFGGGQCLESYGADPKAIRDAPADRALKLIREAIPDTHVRFVETFADTCRFGDYLFVHAGVRPGVSLDQQQQSDLRWIREPFLLDEHDHGFVVVHGHTISPQVDERINRIGIDTGAYRSGVLTAVAIEEGRRWYLDTATAIGTPVPAAH